MLLYLAKRFHYSIAINTTFKSHCVAVLMSCAVLVGCSKEDDLDLSAPTIQITSPLPGSTISGDPAITITGTVSGDTDTVTVTYNDVSNPANLSGTSFTYDLTLLPGFNKIIAQAQDATGNRTIFTFTLYYPSLNFTNGMDASLVIGQVDFTGNLANQGSTVAANTLSGVTGTLFKRNNTVLYVPDSGNNRILGYNTVPTVSNSAANFVIGQDNLTSSVTDVTASRFSAPAGVYATDSQFFVADTGNNRILIWDAIPAGGAVDANHVVGQTLMTSNGAGCSSSTLSGPAGVFVVNGKMVVLDKNNNRVLIWNSIPAVDGAAADLVVGQQNFDTCMVNDSDGDGATDAVSASTLNNPGGIWTDGNYFLVADTGNHRVLVWDTFPAADGQAADWVLGQSDMVSAVPDLSDSGLTSPKSVASNGKQIVVADSGNFRALLWLAFPAANKPVADSVLGQPDFITNTPIIGQSTLESADNVFVDRTSLYAVDGNRIMVFKDPAYE